MTTNTTEKSLAGISLWVAIGGAVWGLFILFASGMSNVSDSARRQVFLAFPVASVALLLSSLALFLAFRRSTVRSSAKKAIAAFLVSACTILLAYAALRSYS